MHMDHGIFSYALSQLTGKFRRIAESRWACDATCQNRPIRRKCGWRTRRVGNPGDDAIQVLLPMLRCQCPDDRGDASARIGKPGGKMNESAHAIVP